MTTTLTNTNNDTQTLSLYEDNAGGLHLLRHCDNLVISGLENLFAGNYAEEGHLLDADQAEYFEDSTPLSLEADGWAIRTEPDGADAICFERDAQTPNGINLVAIRKNGAWDTYPDRMGTNAQIACNIV